MEARLEEDHAAISALGADMRAKEADAWQDLARAIDEAEDVSRAESVLGLLRYYRRFLEGMNEDENETVEGARG